jgi:hypothetical protein
MSELTISYSRGKYTVNYQEGFHKTTWGFAAEEFSADLLRDILSKIEPHNQGPLFLQPASQPDMLRNSPSPVRNEGAERADRAAREAELALRNGGAALGPQGGGVGFEGVPAFEDGALKALALPGDWNPVDVSAIGRAIADAAAKDE